MQYIIFLKLKIIFTLSQYLNNNKNYFYRFRKLPMGYDKACGKGYFLINEIFKIKYDIFKYFIFNFKFIPKMPKYYFFMLLGYIKDKINIIFFQSFFFLWSLTYSSNNSLFFNALL